MKITRLILIIGWFCLISGLTFSYWYPKNNSSSQKENITQEIKSKRNINTRVKDAWSRSKLCTKELLFFEARNTSSKEKEAILDIILNRYRSEKYPSKICSIIQQNRQFSYRDGLEDKTRIILPAFQSISSSVDKEAYLEINSIVENRFNTKEVPENKVLPTNAMWYYAKDIKKKPKWSRKFIEISLDKKFKHRYYASVD